jgi:hypothetical protein
VSVSLCGRCGKPLTTETTNVRSDRRGLRSPCSECRSQARREASQRREVEVKGRVSWDKENGLLSLDIETTGGKYGCLSWAFDADDEFYQDVMDMLDPPPLESA